MPILYPIAAIFFIIGYWVDKLLLLRFNRKPPAFDSSLNMGSLAWFKWILLLHVVMGTIMYSNSSIAPSKYVIMRVTNEQIAKALPGWRIENFLQLHIFIFVCIIASVSIILGFWTIIKSLVKYVVSCFCQDEDEAIKSHYLEENPQWDFYRCVSFETLINEFSKAQRLRSRFRSMLT